MARQPVNVCERILSCLLRYFFYLIYEPLAWTYDGVAWVVSLGRWKSWVLSVLPYLKGPRVLELGHGTGHLLRALMGEDLQVVGLDVSFQMGRLVCFRGLGVENAVCVNGYAQFMPFGPASFHQVVATFPSDYFWETRTLQEIRRVLVPGGELAVLPIAWITGTSLPEKVLRRVYQFTGQAPPLDDPDVPRRLVEYIQSAGFAVRPAHMRVNGSTLLHLRARKLT